MGYRLIQFATRPVRPPPVHLSPICPFRPPAFWLGWNRRCPIQAVLPVAVHRSRSSVLPVPSPYCHSFSFPPNESDFCPASGFCVNHLDHLVNLFFNSLSVKLVLLTWIEFSPLNFPNPQTMLLAAELPLSPLNILFWSFAWSLPATHFEP